MKIMLDKGAILPTRAHPWDAGLDLYAKEGGVLRPGYHEVFDTGIHVQIPEGYYGEIRSRSGLMVNHHIVTDGTIDANYTGSIRVKLFNLSNRAYKVQVGDKIAQLVIVPCLLPELEIVDHLEETDRGDGGFGSTGR
jgi:dUTP pyrophosphatase